MPLVTDNIEEARAAYRALEMRTQSAERLVQSLRSALQQARALGPVSLENARDLRQIALNREADNERLRTQLQQAIVAKADLGLESLIAAVGLAAVLGEATMPDRVISQLSATLQSYVLSNRSGVGLRFFQTGIDPSPEALSSTSFQMSKIPPPPAVPAPRNLYAVLQDKQRVYTDPFWKGFVTNTQPPSNPAAQIVTAAATMLATAANWNFPYVLRSAGDIGKLEKTLSQLTAASVSASGAAAYSAAADSLLAVASALNNTPIPVAADLLSLTASLDNVTRVARTLIS